MNPFENTDKEVFLAEEIENRLAIEARQYRHQLDENWQTVKFDAQYFIRFVLGTLYTEFMQAIYDRIKPLNSHEANRFLTLSVAQFSTHTPGNREQAFILNYWHTYWYPNVIDDNVNENDAKYAKHVWSSYSQYFYQFKDATERALSDFKSGLLGMPNVSTVASNIHVAQIEYQRFNDFLKQFEYNYPYKISVWEFKHSAKGYFDYFKREILDNLITLEKDKQKGYLKKLRNEIENLKQHGWATQATIEPWLSKHNLVSEHDLQPGRPENELYTILNQEPPTFAETQENDFNPETESIQHDFYNYYYGMYLEMALSFIHEQLMEVEPALAPIQDKEQKPLRIKTSLSVPQLSLLFSMLNDLKPNIFEVKSDAELHRFISANFETKKSGESGISTEKLRQLFNQPDSKAADFWETHLQTMISQARKLK